MSKPPVRENEAFAGIGFDGAPGVVRLFGELHVVGRDVREPDDARMVVRLAARVAELELLDAQDARTALGQPKSRAAADSPQAQDDRVVFVVHCASLATASSPNRAAM